MPITYPYTQYGGIWKLNAASAAQGAGTWAVPPQPHLFSWGSNANGQLGLNNTTNYSSPKQVGSLTNWLNLSGGFYNFVATKTDGTLWAWGDGNYGQLGLGNNLPYSSPKQVGSLTNWLNVASGYFHTAAIKTDGTLWTWGSNTYGNLGIGTSGAGTEKSSPVQVGALTDWKLVSSGGNQTFAIKTNGTLWAWGENNRGQLGTGNTNNYSSPKQIGVLTNWLSVVCGAKHTIATKTDGTLWSWGRNHLGQLGLGNTTYYSSPKQIGALTDWTEKTSCGQFFTHAIKSNGTLWGWGRNDFGQLGLGNIGYYSSPKQVGSLTNWSIVGAVSNSGYGIKTDGTFWSWGYNAGVGYLGLGNTTNYSSPKQVGLLTSWVSVIRSGGISVLAIAKT